MKKKIAKRQRREKPDTTSQTLKRRNVKVVFES